MTGSVADGWEIAPSLQHAVTLADRYVLGPLIGRGGAAEVFRALDLQRDEPVAVKVFLAGMSGVEQRRQQREMLALIAMDHPGLVRLRYAGLDGGRRYLVMDYVGGPTLRERLLDGPLGVAEVIELGGALADALAYVHARAMVHRDVKPANVLLDESGPRLVDFGIAQRCDATRMTATGFTVGTPAYLAPEQVRGEPVGSAADVYALGLVLLECLTGRCEYSGGPLEAAIARLHRRPAVPADLPRWFRSLLTAMTAHKPAPRPTAAAVAAVLHGQGLEPGHTTVMQMVGWHRRRTLAASAGVLAGSALVTAISLGTTSATSTAPVAGGATVPPAASNPGPAPATNPGPANPMPLLPHAPAPAPAVAVPARAVPRAVQPQARTYDRADSSGQGAAAERGKDGDGGKGKANAASHGQGQAGKGKGKDGGKDNGGGGKGKSG